MTADELAEIQAMLASGEWEAEVARPEDDEAYCSFADHISRIERLMEYGEDHLMGRRRKDIERMKAHLAMMLPPPMIILTKIR